MTHIPTRVRMGPVIAIDGPVAAGKSTVAKLLAQRLGYHYVDTGAMYRSVAWLAQRQGVNLYDEDAVVVLARTLRIAFVPPDSGERILVNSEDVTEAIRSPEVSDAASVVSAHPTVRQVMVAMQRAFAAPGGLVMEGRDIGTVVFPDADVKIYLDATPDERARRRHKELRARGIEVAYDAVARAEEERDRRDATRDHSPLRPAPDAIIIDTTHRSVETVVAQILSLLRAR